MELDPAIRAYPSDTFSIWSRTMLKGGPEGGGSCSCSYRSSPGSSSHSCSRGLAPVRRSAAAPKTFAAVALLAQIVIFTFVPGGDHSLPVWIHVSTYAIALIFVLANLRVPGLPLIGLGGALNATAIALNAGLMPASEHALRTAGLAAGPGFLNSAVRPGAHVAFLGDIFAMPSWLPLHNVFSVGDVLISVGILVGLVVFSRPPIFERTWAKRAVHPR